jgi:GAF domain-containing protein/HAMP domain-containing protein
MSSNIPEEQKPDNGRNRSIAVRLPLLLVAALTLSALLTGLIASGFSYLHLSDLIRDNQAQQASLQAQQIAQQLDQQASILRNLAHQESIQLQLAVANERYTGMTAAVQEAYLSGQAELWTAAVASADVDTGQSLLASVSDHPIVSQAFTPWQAGLSPGQELKPEFMLVDRQGALVAATWLPDDYRQTESWWWTELRADSQVIQRGPWPAIAPAEQQQLEFVVAVLDANGSFAGAVHSSYSFAAVRPLLAPVGSSSNQVLLLNNQGQVVQPPPDMPALAGVEIPVMAAVNDLYRWRSPDNTWYLLTAAPINTAAGNNRQPDWYVAVLQPRTSLLAPIAAAVVPAFLAASFVGLVIVILLYTGYIYPLARDMHRLQLGAAAVQEGNLQTQIAIQRNDELGALAHSFNTIAAQMQYQRQRQEQLIAARTAALQKQARQLETAANVGRAANASLDLAVLMHDAVNLIRGGFDHYHVAIFLIDNQNKYAVVHEASGEVGRLLKDRPYRLAIGSHSLIGQATASRQAQIVNDVHRNSHYHQNPLLPDTHSEAVIPLIAQGNLLGVLDIQSSHQQAFAPESQALLQLMADQIAAAIYNARLFRELQIRLQETEALFQFTALLTATLEITEIYHRAARALSEQLDAARCRFAYWEAGAQVLSTQLEFIYYEGPRLVEEFVTYSAGEALLQEAYLLKVVRTSQPLLLQLDDDNVPPSEAHFLETRQLVRALHLPLVTADQPLGVVSLYRSQDQRPFSDYEIRLAQAMVNQAATTLNNALLTSQAHQQVAQMSTLYRVSQTLALAPDLRSIFVNAQQEIMSLTAATGISLLLLTEDHTRLQWLYAFEYGQELDLSQVEPASIDQGFSGYVARTKEPLLLKEVTPEIQKQYGSWTLEGSAATTSYLGLPLQVTQAMIGVLAVENAEETHAFDEQDVQLLTTIAGSVAIAIQNQRLWEQTQEALIIQSEQGLRLQAAAEVAAAASNILSEKELMQTAVQLIQERFALYYVGIFLLDETGRDAVLQAGTGEAGRQLLASDYRLPLDGRSLAGAAVSSGQVQIRQDVRAAADWQPKPYLPDTRGEVVLPLRARSQTIGALSVQSTQANEFTPELVAILQTMSDQLATAIQNASLFSTVQTNLRRSEQLYQAGQRISTATDSQVVYQALVNFASQMGPFTAVHIATLDPQMPGHVHLPLIWSKETLRPQGQAAHLPLERFPAAQLLLQNERTSLANIAHNPQVDRRSRILLRRNGLNSCTILPIQAEGEWLATLTLHQESRQPATEVELQPLLTLCAQAGITLSNQRLLAETNALYRISRLLNRARSQVQTMRITVQELANHLRLEQCRIYLYNELTGEGLLAATFAAVDEVIPARLSMAGDYVFEMLANSQRPLFLQDDPDLSASQEKSVATLLRTFGLKSSLLVPAISQGKPIGFISLDSYQERPFTGAESNFVQAIVDQFTTTIEGIKLFDEAMRRAQELVSLNQIGARISSSLGLEELALTVHDQTGQILDNSIFLMARFDAQSYTYEPILFMHNGRRVAQKSRILETHEPLFQFLLGTAPLVANPHTPIMRNEGSLNHLPVEEWPQSAVWVPLRQEGKASGLLCLMSHRPHAYSNNDIQLLRSIATQAGLALSNAALFQQTRQNVAELRTLFAITQSAAASIDAQERVENMVTALHHSLRQANVSILLLKQNSEVAETVAQRGQLPLPPMLMLADTVIGRAVALSQPLLVNDLREAAELRVMPRPSLAQLVVPLQLGRRTIGVINVESDEANAFTEADLRMLQTVSVSLATTIESGRLFQEIQAANEQLRELDRVKTQFLANMSHELRTPLNSIIGFSRVILKGIDGPITPEQEEDLNAIYTSGQHLLRLINDILDLAKIEAGKIALAFEEISLEELAQSVLATIRGLISEKPVALSWEIEEDLPLIMADPVRMRQILLNLLSNAAKFTDKGRIRLDIQQIIPGHVDIAVQDTGAGIRPEDQSKLFRAFEQADISPTRTAGGSGLGLSIAKRLVELHHGDIWFESQLGQGSTFIVRLPIRQHADDQPIGRHEADIPAETRERDQILSPTPGNGRPSAPGPSEATVDDQTAPVSQDAAPK